MTAIVPISEEAETVEDVGFFFRFLGGLQLSHHEDPIDAPGQSRLLACASKYGLTFFSDLTGTFVTRTSELLQRASKDVGNDSYTPLKPSELCLSILPTHTYGPPSSLSLSADQLLLAVTCQDTLCIYSVPDIAHAGEKLGGCREVTQPLVARALTSNNGSISSFAWCPAPSHEASYLVVTDTNALMIGSLGISEHTEVAEGVEAAAWAPAGTNIAYIVGGTSLVFAQQDGTLLSTVHVTHPAVPADELVVESLSWVEPGQLVMCASQLVDGEEEEAGDAFLMHFTWQGGAVPQDAQRAKLSTYTPFMIEPDATQPLQGPYLHCTSVPEWHVCVVSHRKVLDEHVQLLQLGAPGSAAQQVMVTEDSTRIALPSGPGGTDNYVVGLAFDTSCDAGPLRHPTNPDAADVVPTPLLLVLTTDGALRLYCFGHLHKQEVLTKPPVPLPVELPSSYLEAVAASAGGASGQQAEESGLSTGTAGGGAIMAPRGGRADEEAAAKAPLPDDEEDFDDEASEAGSGTGAAPATAAVPARKAQQGMEAAAAAVGLPDDDEDDFGDEHDDRDADRERDHRDGKRRSYQPRMPARTVSSGSSTRLEGAESEDEVTSPGTSLQTPSKPAARAAPSPVGLPAPSSLAFGAFSLGSATTSFGASSSSPSQGGSSWAAPTSPSSPHLAFGSKAPAASAPAFGALASAPAFGSGIAPAPLFGSLASTPAFGSASAAPAFGALAAKPGAAPAFGWGLPPAAAAAAEAPKPAFSFAAAAASEPASTGLFGSGFGAAAGGFGGLSLQGQAATAAATESKGLFAPPAAAFKPAVATDDFQPASTFQGACPGFRFTTGDLGTGYYRDKHVAESPQQPAAEAAPQQEDQAGAPVPAQAAAAAALRRAGQQPPAAPEPAAQQQPPAAAAAAQQQQPAAAPTPPPVPEVPAPRPKLTDGSPEVVSMEADFLKSIHEVRKVYVATRVSLELLLSSPGSRTLAPGQSHHPASRTSYAEVTAAVEALREGAGKLKKAYSVSCRQVQQASVGLEEVQRRLVALQMFQRQRRLEEGSEAAVQRKLPLEPALAKLRSNIIAQLHSIERCMEDMEEQLDAWEQQQHSKAHGRASSRPTTTVVYDTINLQADILRNLRTKVSELNTEMERLGIRKPGPEADSSKVLERWAADDYSGLAPGDDEDYGATTAPAARAEATSTAGHHRDGDGAPATPFGRRPLHLLSGDRLEWCTPQPASGGRGFSPIVAGSGGLNGSLLLTPAGSVGSAAHGSPGTGSALWSAAASRLAQVTQSGGRVRTTVVRRPQLGGSHKPSGTSTQMGSTGLDVAVAAATSAGAACNGTMPAATTGATGKRGASEGPAAAGFPAAAAPLFGAPPGAGAAAAAPMPSFNFSVQAPAAAAAAAAAAAPSQAAAKPAAPAAKPKAASSQPPLPSAEQMRAAQVLHAKVAPPQAAAAAAAPKPAAKSSQPPVPSMQAMQAAQKLSLQAAAAGAGTKAGAAGQPPVPSMAAVKAAQQLGAAAKSLGAAAAPAAAPAEGAGSSSEAAGQKPKKAASSQPPVPSMASMAAAQKLSAQFAQQKQEAAAPAAPAAASAAAAAASSAASMSGGFSLQGSTAANTASASSGAFSFGSFGGFGAASIPAGAGSSSATTTTAAAAAPISGFSFSSAAAPATAPTTTAAPSTSAFGFGAFGSTAATATSSATAAAAPAATQPASFGFGAFGSAAASAAASSAASSAAAAASPPSPFGFGAFGSPAPATAGPSNPAASPFGSPAPAASSSIPAFSFSLSDTSPPATPAPASQQAFGFATAPATPATPALGAATTFGTAAAAPAFGTTSAAPAFGAAAPALAFGTTAPAPAFGTAAAAAPAFGAATAVPAFGSSTAAAATSPTPAFGSGFPVAGGFGSPTQPQTTPAASPFGQPSPLGASGGAFGGGAFGGGVTSAFGSGGFGQPSMMGSAGVAPAFSQPSPLGGGFGQPSPLGQPAFGQSTGFGFGQHLSPPAAPVAPATGGAFAGFGQASGMGNAFATLGQSAGGGGGGFAAFGQAASGGNAFSAMAQTSGQGFGGQATSGFGGGGAFPPAPSPAQSASPSMWAPRK